MRNILHSFAQIDVSPLPNSDKSNTDYAQGFVGTILPISAIMYALIGLAISLAAFSIVTFVVRGVS